MSNLNVNNITPLAGSSGTVSVSGSLLTSGNSTLGDATTDTHIFTGNITASGALSASGTITANAFIGGGAGITGVTAEWDGTHTGTATFTGNITASSHISASGNVYAVDYFDNGTNISSIYSPVEGHASIATVGTIGTGVWQGTAIASGYIAADAITGAKIADDAIDSEHYAAGSIDTAHIADNQVTLSKMAGITRGSIIIGNSSGDPAALAIGTNDYVLTSDGTDLAWEAAGGKSTEEIQDIAGAMWTSNTESDITVTYQDGDGTIDIDVDDVYVRNDGSDTTSGTITAAGFTTTGTWTFDEYSSGTIGITTVQDSGTTFNDNDTSLMTAAAISDAVGENIFAKKLTIGAGSNNEWYPVPFQDTGGGYLLRDDSGMNFNPSTNTLRVSKLIVQGTSENTGTITIDAAVPLVFEGATVDAYQTSIRVVDPTADQDIYISDVGGYFAIYNNDPGDTPISATVVELNYVDGVTSAIQTQIDTKAPTASPTFTGNIIASGNISASGNIIGNILFNTSSISSTGNAQGDIIKFGNSTTVAGAIYAHTGSGWSLAHSGSNGSASSSLGLAVGTNSTTNGMLLRGMANIGYDPGGDNGCALYLQAPGSASSTLPATSGHVSRVVGWNYGSDTIYFNPDNTWVLLA